MKEIFEEIMAENFPEFKKKKTQDHKMKGFQLRYRKKHTCSHFFGMKLGTSKPCPPPTVKASSKEEHTSKKKKNQKPKTKQEAD